MLVVDQYDGRVSTTTRRRAGTFDAVGFPALMDRALEAVTPLRDGFVVAGFSNGAGMAEHVATQRVCGGALLFSGALPLDLLGGVRWRGETPAQIHYAQVDPFRRQEWIDASSVTSPGPGPLWRSSTTPVAATCSPTRACRPSTIRSPRRPCGKRAEAFCRDVS